MALKKCKECEKEVSQYAKKCPNCGVDNPTISNSEMVIALIVLVFLGVIGWSYFASSEDEIELVSLSSLSNNPTQKNTQLVNLRIMK